jgi:hypothetical protein
MFEDLFTSPKALDRYSSGALLDERGADVQKLLP